MNQHDQTEVDRLKDEMRRLIYLFSHDMRNPLVNMKALLNEVRLTFESVKRGDLDLIEQELPDTMQMLDQSVARMSAMIDGANEIYHCMFDALECEEVNLKPLVERVAHRFVDIERVDLQIKEMPSIWADPLAVTRIVEELLKNSLQAIDGKGIISVAVNQQGNFDELIVSDSGKGTTQDGLERLFEPFYSGSDQPKSAPGMGLAVVKALIEAHGGAARCESKSGEGTVLYVSFPHRECRA